MGGVGAGVVAAVVWADAARDQQMIATQTANCGAVLIRVEDLGAFFFSLFPLRPSRTLRELCG
jgi:hypothetical protein